MAISEQVSSQLRLVFYDGEDPSTGDPIYKNKNFNNVKTDATADQLLVIAKSFSDLQERPLHAIERRDQSEITEE